MSFNEKPENKLLLEKPEDVSEEAFMSIEAFTFVSDKLMKFLVSPNIPKGARIMLEFFWRHGIDSAKKALSIEELIEKTARTASAVAKDVNVLCSFDICQTQSNSFRNRKFYIAKEDLDYYHNIAKEDTTEEVAA